MAPVCAFIFFLASGADRILMEVGMKFYDGNHV